MKITHEKFQANLRRFCDNPKRYSIKPFMNKATGIKTLMKKDKGYTEGIIESCQWMCFLNVLTAWTEGTMSNLDAVKYMHENYQEFRDYEAHVLKFEVIETEEQAKSLIDRFCQLDTMFKTLSKEMQEHKGYSAKAFIEQETGQDYEEVISRALISKEWQFIISCIHETCLDNGDSDLMSGRAKIEGELSEKKIDEYLDEKWRWERLINGEESPRVPLKINLGSNVINDLTNTNQSNEVTTQPLPISSADKERIERYKEKQMKGKPGFELQVSKSEDGVYNLKYKDHEKLAEDVVAATFYAITGSTSDLYARKAISRTTTACFIDKVDENDIASETNAIIGALSEMEPKDITDGILCRRILTLDNQVTEYLKQAALSKNSDARDRYINNAAKLSRLLNETIETRTRYLRKGEQKYTVTHQHVEVHGGQTVIGNVSKGVQGHEK